MSAFTSKGTGARLKAKNAEMAARMKQDGVKRITMNCPICHRLIGILSLYSHMGKAGCGRK